MLVRSCAVFATIAFSISKYLGVTFTITTACLESSLLVESEQSWWAFFSKFLEGFVGYQHLVKQVWDSLTGQGWIMLEAAVMYFEYT